MRTSITVEAEPSEIVKMMKVDAYADALWRTGQEIFRPARKHGYADKQLNLLVEENVAVAEAIGLLEDKFYEIINELGLEIE